MTCLFHFHRSLGSAYGTIVMLMCLRPTPQPVHESVPRTLWLQACTPCLQASLLPGCTVCPTHQLHPNSRGERTVAYHRHSFLQTMSQLGIPLKDNNWRNYFFFSISQHCFFFYLNKVVLFQNENSFCVRWEQLCRTYHYWERTKWNVLDSNCQRKWQELFIMWGINLHSYINTLLCVSLWQLYSE